MTSQSPDEPKAQTQSLDDPVMRWRAVKALLICAPFAFFGCYILAWLLGAAPAHAGLIAVVAVAMCLGAAAAIRVLGSKAWIALVVLKVALLLVNRR